MQGGDGDSDDEDSDDEGGEDGDVSKGLYKAHGVMMIIGWGVLVPLGAILAAARVGE